MSEADLAELIGAFNEVTQKLHGAHELLRAEVVRLQNELRQANEQIERSRRLAALGEMAAGIAHEVRNPLGSIRLYARMLEEDLMDRPNDRAIAVKIGSAVRGLDGVVTDVLSFAKELRVRVEDHNVEELISAAVEECLADDRGGAGGGGGTVRVNRLDMLARADRTSVRAACDAALVHRALVNVIRNAIQAMRDHRCAEPELTFGVAERVVAGPEGSGGGAFVVISVRDSGPGIPADVLPRMFNPFFTTRATGTGLGLAIVNRIMDAHGGRVVVRNVDGEVGGGAIVELFFPVEERDETRRATESHGERQKK